MSRPQLFSPLAIRGVTLPNRIVVAPMHQYSAERGFANDWHLMNAGRYAAGGAGFVMMESTKVERRGCGTVGDLGLWDDAFVPGLERIVDFAHACGSSIGIQLGHSGRKARVARPWEGGRPLQPDPAIAQACELFDRLVEQLRTIGRRRGGGAHGRESVLTGRSYAVATAEGVIKLPGQVRTFARRRRAVCR